MLASGLVKYKDIIFIYTFHSGSETDKHFASTQKSVWHVCAVRVFGWSEYLCSTNICSTSFAAAAAADYIIHTEVGWGWWWWQWWEQFATSLYQIKQQQTFFPRQRQNQSKMCLSNIARVLWKCGWLFRVNRHLYVCVCCRVPFWLTELQVLFFPFFSLSMYLQFIRLSLRKIVWVYGVRRRCRADCPIIALTKIKYNFSMSRFSQRVRESVRYSPFVCFEWRRVIFKVI